MPETYIAESKKRYKIFDRGKSDKSHTKSSLTKENPIRSNSPNNGSRKKAKEIIETKTKAIAKIDREISSSNKNNITRASSNKKKQSWSHSRK